MSSPDYRGVYAIVIGGTVRRITVGARSDVALGNGIGVGATEAEVTRLFADVRETPHEYQMAPAKYLIVPAADKSEPALRFEIGRNGRVDLMHVGVMPALGYTEACA